MNSPKKSLVIAAFAAIYVIWGSTYLAIQMAIQSTPPLLMAGFRFFFAGLPILAFFRWKEEARPAGTDWKNAAIVGALLLAGGNGGVVFGEQWLPSSQTALLIATVPLCIAVMGWATGVTSAPLPAAWVGLLLGVAGVCALFNPFGDGLGSSHKKGLAVTIFAAVCWSAGSLWARNHKSSLPAFQMVGMQMVCGGLILISAGAALGEFQGFHIASVTRKSLIAFAYLIVFGSWLGFTAYVWLLRVCHPARVATYAFVNPVVAVFLGWSMNGEKLTARMLGGAAVIIAAVALAVLAGTRPQSPKPAPVPKAGSAGA
jgi:drug/metabolite transporter (DMT)-like permease